MDIVALVIQLLDRLPLPLMLQTSTGQVLSQNLSWQQRVGGLQNPEWIRQAAASLLEVNQAGIPSLSPLEDNLGGSCRLGVESNTCVCTCPMINGHDQVWQFTKIPLNLNLSGQTWTVAASALATVSPSLPLHFQLAALVHQQTLAFQHLPQGAPDEAIASVAPAVAETSEIYTEVSTLWLVLAEDQTEQQQVARELNAKNADLVQLNRLKDEFLSCITHELKTPLTAILGLSSLLQMPALGELNERQGRYVRLIHQSGRHLISIVNDMLDLTRMETGQLELGLESVNIAAVCDRAIEQVAQLKPVTDETESPSLPSSLAQSCLTERLILEIEPGLESLIADEGRLRQMLVNLLSNAIKFTEVEGKLGLKISAWESWIAFTVWDTGIGIPADKQHLIFQKFQQLENPLTRRFEGTGLGLVLTQRLARLHGGDITFTSKEGVGSEFTLLLPPQPPRHLQPTLQLNREGSQAPEFPENQSSLRVNRLALIVESSPESIETLHEQLIDLGYRVAIARSGTEALEKARRLQPRIIFLNPVLPQLSGWDVLTLLKADLQTRHLSVVITATQAEQEQTYRHQADSFLKLPITSQALQYTLSSLRQLVQPARAATRQLTVLYLSEEISPSTLEQSEARAELINLLQLNHYRVLEVDDLEQAELLARVWKLGVILLDSHIANPVNYLQEFCQYPGLTSRPLITLTQALTQAANQMPELTVFPCLTLPQETVTAGKPESAALLQVIQIATGLSWQPI